MRRSFTSCAGPIGRGSLHGSRCLTLTCLVTALCACTGEIGSHEPGRAGPPTGQPNDPGKLDTDGDGIADAIDTNGDGVQDPGTAPNTPQEPVVPPTDVGTVTIHRLNNAEYNNTVRDLLGTSSTPADEFPLDGSGAGFDNLASVLTLSAPHLVAMHAAAEELATAAMQDSAQRSRIVTCDLASDPSCTKTSLLDFVQRAWRRPVTEAELSHYYTAIDRAIAAGDTAEQALAMVLEAVLLSPHFLFRVELDSDPRSTAARPLNGHELASRLSYFLWSSMPDDALFSAASWLLERHRDIARRSHAHVGRSEGPSLGRKFRGPVALPAQGRRGGTRCRAVPKLRPRAA